MFTEKLPNCYGVSKAQIAKNDNKHVRGIQKAMCRGAAKGAATPTNNRHSNQSVAHAHISKAAGSGSKTVSLPLQSHHKAGSSSGGGGQRFPSNLSNRNVAAVASYSAALQAAQEDFKEVQGGPTCNRCKARNRNDHHDHRSCAYSTCNKCKRGVHRHTNCRFECVENI